MARFAQGSKSLIPPLHRVECPPSPNTMGITSHSLTIQTERWRILDSCNKRGHMPGDETWGMFEIALFLASAICIFSAAALAVAA
jgi:hypothetical protein